MIDLDEVVLTEVRGQRSLARADIDARRHADQRVRVTLGERGGTVELTVSDDGSGIPAADRLRIFERFTRLDEARSREVGGLGGARLVIRLPAAPPPADPRETA
ncbi:hypothetical protein JBE27_34060 [Streptomyces albiflaviniger]|nr:hypothetical protein [Streptomyces albiflaviniger]